MTTQYIAELEDAELLFVHTIGDLRDKEMLVALGIKYGSKAIVHRAYELSKESAMKWLAPIDDVELLKKDKCKK